MKDFDSDEDILIEYASVLENRKKPISDLSQLPVSKAKLKKLLLKSIFESKNDEWYRLLKSSEPNLPSQAKILREIIKCYYCLATFQELDGKPEFSKKTYAPLDTSNWENDKRQQFNKEFDELFLPLTFYELMPDPDNNPRVKELKSWYWTIIHETGKLQLELYEFEK